MFGRVTVGDGGVGANVGWLVFWTGTVMESRADVDWLASPSVLTVGGPSAVASTDTAGPSSVPRVNLQKAAPHFMV